MIVDNLILVADGVTLNTRGKLREMNVEPFNMAADTLFMEMATPPPPTKAQEFFKTVVDSSETMLHKVVATIEHPSEFIKTGHLAELPPPLPSTASNSSSSTNYQEAHLDVGNNYQRDNNTNDYSDYTDHSAGRSSPSPLQQTKSRQDVSTNGKSKRDKQQQRENSSRNKGAAGSQSPSQKKGKSAAQTEEEKQATAERWEAELQRVKREKLWEAEVARIKADRILQEEEDQRRQAEEAQAQENARQGKLTPMPKHKKRGSESEAGPEVVATGCTACIIS